MIALRITSVIGGTRFVARPDIIEEVVCARCAAKPLKGYRPEEALIVETLNTHEEAVRAAEAVSLRQDDEAFAGCWRCAEEFEQPKG